MSLHFGKFCYLNNTFLFSYFIFMLFIRRIKTLEKTNTNTKTHKNNENKHIDDFFWSSNKHNKINELKYAW